MVDLKICSRREALASAALGCLAGRALSVQDPKTDLRASTVVIVRHAEKDLEDTRDPVLTERGHRRASMLADLLGSAGVSELFSTGFRRTQQTLQPLAERLGLTVGGYQAGDSEAFARGLTRRQAGDLVVVAGHSNTLPAMVRALGGRLTDLGEKADLADDEYDRVVLLSLAAAGDKPMVCLQTLDLRMTL